MLYENKTLPGDEPRILVTPEFVEKNKLSLSRSQAELLERIDEIKRGDYLGFRVSVVLDFLDFENAKALLKEEYVKKVESGEEKFTHISDIMEAAQDFLDYMVFAWMKAQDERGISASRSIEKLSEMLWVMGRPDLAEVMKDEDLYNPYGAPALIRVCEDLGIEVPKGLREFAGKKGEE